ncbi:cytochrome b-c1 complex subunit 7 [Phlyctochytrium arcticum]|nr:cytochrome b-c1 complex subunit 7 [Phlyctochytrium arcticum]
MSALTQLVRGVRNSQTGKALSEWHHNLMGYRKSGMKYDDLIPEEGDVVQEALTRLPPKDYYDRIFRQRRAINVSGQQGYLDKKDWITAEQDQPYLTPLIDQVQNEVTTMAAFDNMLAIPKELKNRNTSTAQ